MIDLRVLAQGGSLAPANQSTVYVQTANPNQQDCNNNCIIPPTPSSVTLATPDVQKQCKIKFVLSGPTGNTGATGSSILLGFRVNSEEPGCAFEEVAMVEDFDFDLFPIIEKTECHLGTIDGLAKLKLFQTINEALIAGNFQIKATAISDAALEAQLAEDLVVVIVKPEDNMSSCSTRISPNDCSVCVNPTGASNSIATFPACPVFITPTSGVLYRWLPGTSRIEISFCVEASDRTFDYIPC